MKNKKIISVYLIGITILFIAIILSITYGAKSVGLSDIMDILNKKFLFFFDKIYYNNLRNFNLKDFGLLDLKIELPKNFELYENLLMKNKNDLKYDKYKMNMEQCIKDHFLGVSKDEDEKDD